MHTWFYRCAVAVFVLAVYRGAFADELAASPPADETAVGKAGNNPLEDLGVKAGGTFIFLGDSITFGCGWTEHVENYFYTRFPRTKIRFVNAAVGGDRSWTLEERFDKSVAPLRPQFATIMLGMNDGRYRGYDAGLYERFKASMTTILNRLGQMGTNVVVMSPSHFDRRTRNTVRTEPSNNYNGVLTFYGNWLREDSLRRGLRFVDVNATMSRLIMRERATRHDFKLTTDGIHTDATGDMVIAVAILRELRLSNLVSSIGIDRTQSGWTHSVQGGRLDDFQATDDAIQFSMYADALPWVANESAKAGYELTSASQELNREIFRVSGLAPGKYELKIDGQIIGRYSSIDLSKGIELQDNSATPQHQQAKRVAELNRTRNNYMRLYAKNWFLWALRASERAWIKAHKPGDDRYDEFNTRRLQSEEALKATPRLLKLADEMIPTVYEAAQPQQHVYSLKRL